MRERSGEVVAAIDITGAATRIEITAGSQTVKLVLAAAKLSRESGAV